MRVLILRLSSLGDIILTQPVLAELRALYPGAELHFLCKPEYAELPRMFGLELRVQSYEPSLGWHLRLLRQRYDLIIDLHAKFSTWLIRALVPAKAKAVYNKQRGLRRRIVKGDRARAIESTVRLYYSVLAKLWPDQFNSRSPIRFPQLSLKTASGQAPAASATASGKPVIGLFLGAAHATKAYPLRQWREFIELARGRYSFRLYGSKADSALAEELAGKDSALDVVNSGSDLSLTAESSGADTALALELPTGAAGLANLCGKLTLTQLAAEIAGCDAVISGDSGPMHLAAALNKPQVAIFGGTHPRLGFAPLNGKARVLCADLPCQPCSLHGLKNCPLGHFNCMQEITPQRLLAELDLLVKSYEL